MIYILHLSIIIILFLFFGRNKQTEKYFVNFSFIYVLFVFGQRWMTGTDFPNYLRFYINDVIRGEWGYFGLQTLLRSVDLSFGIFIFMILLITMINFYRFFLKFKNEAILLLTIFLVSEMFLAQMSQIRQYAAISFFLNAYFYGRENKIVKSIINIILAASFHTSAYFLLPFLFIKLPFNKKLLLTFFSFSLFVPFIDIRLIFSIPIFNRYSGYIGGKFDVPLGAGHYVKYFTIVVIILIFLLLIEKTSFDRIDTMIINGIMLYILIYGLSFQFAPLFRVATFFQAFEFIFLLYYSKYLKKIPTLNIRHIVLLLFSGIFLFSAVSDSYLIEDYQFRHLRIYENRTKEHLNHEIYSFYD